MEENFIAINIIDTSTNKTFYNYPIIYFWNKQDSIEDMLNDEALKSSILSKVKRDAFFTTSVFITYVFANEDDEIDHFEKQIEIKDIYEFPVEEMDELANEPLRYVYKCIYKTEAPSSMGMSELYDQIKAKHPSKVNEDIVSKYIEANLIDKYPNLPKSIIEEASKKFLEREK